MIPQAVCLGLTNLVATCLKTQKLGHITQYLFSDFFFSSKCLSALVNSKGIQRNQGKQSSGKRVCSDWDFKSFLKLQYSRCVVPLEVRGIWVGLQTKLQRSHKPLPSLDSIFLCSKACCHFVKDTTSILTLAVETGVFMGGNYHESFF